MKIYKLRNFLLLFVILAHIGITSLHGASQPDKREHSVDEIPTITENIPDPEPDRAAVILNRMAEFHRISGEYHKAEALYQRALLIHETIYGPEHTQVAAILHNMGLLYHAAKDYDRAEQFYKRALAIREKVHGAEDISVAATLNTLAGLYDVRGDYALSEPLYRQALMIDEKIYGADHPDVAIDLKNLALLCHSQGDYAKAKPLYQRALGIEEKTYGAESAVTAMTLNHLGGIHYLLGAYSEAEPFYQRALSIKEKNHGTDFSDLALILYNLGNVYHAQKKYDLAESFYCRTLELIETNDLPELRWRVRNEMGHLLDKEKCPEAAIFFSKHAVNALQKIQEDNSDLEKEVKRFSLVAKEEVYKKLVNMLIDQGRLPEARDVIALMKAEGYTGFADKDTDEHPAKKTGFNTAERAWAKGYGKISELLRETGKANLGFFHFLQRLKKAGSGL